MTDQGLRDWEKREDSGKVINTERSNIQNEV